jgi:hypothetical protein
MKDEGQGAVWLGRPLRVIRRREGALAWRLALRR